MKRITKIPDNKEKLVGVQKQRVAAYCRVSTTSDEQLISLQTQKLHYESYIKSNPNWEFAGIYFDEGITGTKKDKRPNFMRMIADCEIGKINLIITKSISRFSRNTADCLEIVRKLQNLGIVIYFEKENINTAEMESELMLSILSSLAESESVSISENNRWSIKRRYQKGTFIINYPPYGYKNIDGKMSIHKEQAEIVRLIFNMLLEGSSTHTIAKYLNENGIETKRHCKWSSTTISGIISNEKYVGDVMFQKTYTDSNFNRRRNKGDVDQYYIQNHHEPIISRDIYEKATQLMEQRRKEKGVEKGSSKYSNSYPFSKKIVCGECGSNFKRRTHSSGEKYIAWCCSKHIQDKEKCSMQFIKEKNIEIAFVNMINKLVYGNKYILKPLLDKLEIENDIVDIYKIDKKIEDNIKRRETLITLLKKGYLENKFFENENSDLLKDFNRLQEEKNSLNNTIKKDVSKNKEVSKLYKFVRKSDMLLNFSEEVFKEYVQKIKVNSRYEITFELKCGLNLKERI